MCFSLSSLEFIELPGYLSFIVSIKFTNNVGRFSAFSPLPAATPMRLLACWTPSLGSSRCFAFFSRCLFSLCFSLASFYSTGYESTSHFFYGVESEAHMIKIFFSYFYFSIWILKCIPHFFFMFSYKYLNILMQSLGLFLVTDFSRDYGS